MFLRQFWFDDRLQHNFTQNLTLDYNHNRLLWVPDLYFYNAKKVIRALVLSAISSCNAKKALVAIVLCHRQVEPDPMVPRLLKILHGNLERRDWKPDTDHICFAPLSWTVHDILRVFAFLQTLANGSGNWPDDQITTKFCAEMRTGKECLFKEKKPADEFLCSPKVTCIKNKERLMRDTLQNDFHW